MSKCVHLICWPFQVRVESPSPAANLRTKIMDFGGFDSSVVLLSRGGILRPIGEVPGGYESNSLTSAACLFAMHMGIRLQLRQL